MSMSLDHQSPCLTIPGHVGGTHLTMRPRALHVNIHPAGRWTTDGLTLYGFSSRHEFGTSLTKGIAYLKLFMILLQVAFTFVSHREETTRTKMLGEARGTFDTIFRVGASIEDRQSNRFLACHRFYARTTSAEVVGPVNHRPGKLESLQALQTSLDQIGSGVVHSLRR